MLEELDIREFVIAEHLHLRLHEGLTVITGESGAGKSLIIDALDLLLGGRAGPDIVRSGAPAARIEGVFRVSDEDPELQTSFAELGIEPEDGAVIVSREIPQSGRSSARINGRAVVQSTLTALRDHLVDIHSQPEHLSILRPGEHVKYLDEYAGLAAARLSMAKLAAEVRSVRSQMQRLAGDARERARRQERLTYEVVEIEDARLLPGEDGELQRERTRLANAEQIAQLAGQAYTVLEGDGHAAGLTDTLGEAANLVAQLARLDEEVKVEADQLDALQSQISDLARALRSYRDGIEYDPARLQQVEERLDLLAALKRKYGATTDAVLAYREEARSELQQLLHGEEQAGELAAREEQLLAQIAALARDLSLRRREAARRFSQAVDRELGDLGLSHGQFAVRFEVVEDDEGVLLELAPVEVGGNAQPSEPQAGEARRIAFDRMGVDRVEFLVSLNPDEPLRPLARVASGGETSRLMLALKAVLGAADAVPTLVFDEVDIGVGGRIGRVVGDKLARLAANHQVICVTHLPQIASLATQHVTISKTVEEGRATVRLRELSGEERLEEIASMFGGVTASTRASAREMLGLAPS